MEFKYINTLKDVGLSPDQAKVYETMVKNGPLPASVIARQTGITRPLAYKVLEQLVDLSLVAKKDTAGKVAIFTPAHPSELKKLLHKREEEVQATEGALGGILGQMTSQYNLFSGKPNVQFFEGTEAIRRITGDFPETDTEIRQWLDIGIALKEIGEETIRYAKERERRQIKKRMIVPDTEESRSYVEKGTPLTEFEIESDTKNFPTAIQVYDNKVAMLTLKGNKKIGLLIEDQAIAETMKIIFDTTWKKLTTSSQETS